MIFPRSISALAEKNSALLETLNFDPTRDDPFELDTAEAYRNSGLFTPQAIVSIFGENSVDGGSQEVPSDVSEEIGMVLVRPDMFHARSRIERFLAERFRLLVSETVEVTPAMYWQVYSEAILDREMPQSRLSRAAVYIGSSCQLVLFEGSVADDPEQLPVADHTYGYLKGEKGVRQPGTLRGEVVYQSAVDLDLHNLSNQTVGLAADPFGAYRKIVHQLPGKHNRLDYPLLFFTGVGVHVPNFSELQRDLSVFAHGQPNEEIAKLYDSDGRNVRET